jgi:hypothetical protein
LGLEQDLAALTRGTLGWGLLGQLFDAVPSVIPRRRKQVAAKENKKE